MFQVDQLQRDTDSEYKQVEILRKHRVTNEDCVL
jgi:hypothetical protein